MKKKLFYVTLALVALLYGCVGPGVLPSAAAPAELPYARGLARVLDLSVRVTGGTGASATVIVPEQGSWSGASGISGRDVPVTPDMLFDMASIGKTYLAALVLQLAEEGKLDLDDPLHTWLPDYENIDRAITVRQLLNHTSGIHDFVEHPQSPYGTPFDAIDFGAASSPGEVVSKLVGKPYFPPGKGFRYSSTNYVLLRMIVEQVTGSQVSTEIQNRFLDPLGLTHTVVLDSEAFIPGEYRVAHDWWDANGDGVLNDVSSRPRTWIATRSPALIYATAKDLARWSQALYGGEVLEQESMSQMLTFLRPVPGAAGEPLATGYGLGAQELRLGGLEMWGHLGWQYGYTSAMLYLPKRSASITVLINDNNMVLINLAFFSLWLVMVFHQATAHCIAVAFCAVTLLPTLLLWPIDGLIRLLRKRKPGVPRRERAEVVGTRVARTVALLAAVTIAAIVCLRIVHSWSPQAPLVWRAGTPVVRALLVLPVVSALFAVALVIAGALAWSKGCWSLGWRIHYTLVVLAVLIGADLLLRPGA